jgi:hypothetical protein
MQPTEPPIFPSDLCGLAQRVVSLDGDDAGRHDAAIRQIQQPRDHGVGGCREIGTCLPLFDKDKDARPGPVANGCVQQGAWRVGWFGDMGGGVMIGVLVPDQVTTNGCGIDIVEMCQVNVVGIACVQQVPDRQGEEIARLGPPVRHVSLFPVSLPSSFGWRWLPGSI